MIRGRARSSWKLALTAVALALTCAVTPSRAAKRTDRSAPPSRKPASEPSTAKAQPRDAAPATPQDAGEATLWVIDEAGTPQEFADVTLESLDKTRERSALTNERGSVTFTDVAPGRYRATARLDGFTSDVILVDVAKGPAKTRSIVMHPELASMTPPAAGPATLWVTDETGKPLPDVRVVLAPQAGGGKRSMRTDAAGRVVLGDLPSGLYQAKASVKRTKSDPVLVDLSGAPVRSYSIVVHRTHGAHASK